MVDLHARDVCAEVAGLRYVSDHEPGITRTRHGEEVRFVHANGRPVSEEDQTRCAALVIPPAWTEVWICATADGHLQATGRDAKGRKQYRYHADWNALRQMIKYDRLHAFGQVLPEMRRQIESDLARAGLPPEKVMAAVLALMAKTMIRVGNAEYARDNESYGLTTLRSDHVEVHGDEVQFAFRAKSGKLREVSLHDRRLSRIVRQCQDLRGQELFAYRDRNGAVHDVRSEDVNAYLRAISGQDFTAKELRTWGGTVRCFRLLREVGPVETAKGRKKAVSTVLKEVAGHLGNTPTVCRSFYVHPVVLDAFEDGRLFRVDVPERPVGGLGRSEHGVLALLALAIQERQESRSATSG